VRAGNSDPDGARRLGEIDNKVDHIYRCLEDVNKRLAADRGICARRIRSATSMPHRSPLAADAAEPLVTPQLEPTPPPVAAAIIETSANAFSSGVPAFAEAGPDREYVAQAPAASGSTAVPRHRSRRGKANQSCHTLAFRRQYIGPSWNGGVVFRRRFSAQICRRAQSVPIELRLAAVAAGAVALLVVGWRLRESRSGYALILQGGGVGVLYLTVFAALRLYQLVPAEFAFAVLVGIAACSAMLAVLQDSRALAITGAAGGFVAPILTSTGGGNQRSRFFSFYAVLDAGILAIRYYKAWRELNLVGFSHLPS